MELVPLKVKVTLGVDGAGRKAMKYPDFNLIPASKRGNMDWSYFVDAAAIGMNYDACCDFATQDHQFVLMCVPEDFAQEALTRFPTLVEQLDDAGAQAFWDTHVASDQPELLMKTDVLQGLAARKALGEDLSADPDAVAALDPSKTRGGLVRNPRKTWARVKQARQVAVKQPDSSVVAPRAKPKIGDTVDA